MDHVAGNASKVAELEATLTHPDPTLDVKFQGEDDFPEDVHLIINPPLAAPAAEALVLTAITESRVGSAKATIFIRCHGN